MPACRITCLACFECGVSDPWNKQRAGTVAKAFFPLSLSPHMSIWAATYTTCVPACGISSTVLSKGAVGTFSRACKCVLAVARCVAAAVNLQIVWHTCRACCANVHASPSMTPQVCRVSATIRLATIYNVFQIRCQVDPWIFRLCSTTEHGRCVCVWCSIRRRGPNTDPR